MEYADSGTLQNYLKENFERLTWDDKLNLAFQLSCGVSCLHDEEIIHHDLVIITIILYHCLMIFISYVIIYLYVNNSILKIY